MNSGNHQFPHVPGPPSASGNPIDLMDADAVQLGHSANMLAALADALHGNRLPKHVRHACRESFALNAYLITGVLHDYGDHSAYDDDLRHTVEQHVLTYGDDRSSDTGTPLVEFDEDWIAADLLCRLLELAESHGSPWLQQVVADSLVGGYPTQDGTRTYPTLDDLPEVQQ